MNVSNDGSVAVDPILDILTALDVSMERPSGSLVSRVRVRVDSSGSTVDLVTILNWDGDTGRFDRELIAGAGPISGEAAREELQAVSDQFSADNRDLIGVDLETEMEMAKSEIVRTIMEVVLEPADSGWWTGQYDYGFETLYVEVHVVDGALESASAVLDTEGVVAAQSWEFVD